MELNIKQFNNGSVSALDMLSIIQKFSSKVFFDSASVKSLNRGEAIVIAKDDLRKHLHGINLDLIDVVELKYSSRL